MAGNFNHRFGNHVLRPVSVYLRRHLRINWKMIAVAAWCFSMGYFLHYVESRLEPRDPMERLVKQMTDRYRNHLLIQMEKRSVKDR